MRVLVSRKARRRDVKGRERSSGSRCRLRKSRKEIRARKRWRRG
jgi:hypothetical protein